MRSILLAIIAGAASAASSPRASVSLDLGWRFHWGAPAASTCDSPFGLNYTGEQCNGLAAAPAATDASSCAAACCDDSDCQIWQWTSQPPPGGGCWIGEVPPGGCNKSPIWTSFANTTRAPSVPGFARLDYDDSAWLRIDAPHDFILAGNDSSVAPYSQSANQGQAFIPKSVGAYRKHFRVPAAWAGSHIELYVEGMYASSEYYLNGAPLGAHQLGYTSAVFRLDNETLFFNESENILAVYVDATEAQCTGWWYEGGGVFRGVRLTASSRAGYVLADGLFGSAAVSGAFSYPAAPADGVTATGVLINATAELSADVPSTAVVTFTVRDAAGVAVASAAAPALALAPGALARAAATLTLPGAAQAWSVARPYLYSLAASVSVGGVATDEAEAPLGVRTVRWDAAQGVLVNEEVVRFRAFCDHESLAVVGMAVPPRLNLFRFQAMRGMGGNGRRFSHNPPAPMLLQLADRLGVLTLDENRVFELGLAHNMADLVRRDRSHPSVIFWSFCNEPGCNNADKSAPVEPTASFKTAVEASDGTRAVTGNMCVDWGDCPSRASYLTPPGLPMSAELDVQGFSHVSSDVFSAYHAAWPQRPLVASECCSCETQRGEDADLQHNASLVFYPSFNADCVSQQTNWALGLPFVAGSFVWTAFDYYGEPDKWPHVSSSFGSYDLAGFPKAAVWWYRAWWLGNTSAAAPDRPPIANTAVFVHIVESWRANPGAPAANRSINVYSNAPRVRVATSAGADAGVHAMPAQGWVRVSLPFAPGSITASALAADGATVLATHTKASWGPPAALRLSVDAPSPATGTGGALFLDGADAALVRATVVDAAGAVCEDATTAITWAVTGGPGALMGTANGDPADQQPVRAATRTAYHGLARAVVRVTQASAVAEPGALDAAAALALLAAVNPDAAVVPLGGAQPPAITVAASAPGLVGAAISIATSVDLADSVLAVAAANVAAGFIGE